MGEAFAAGIPTRQTNQISVQMSFVNLFMQPIIGANDYLRMASVTFFTPGSNILALHKKNGVPESGPPSTGDYQ
jgi:hypothetical protein